MSGWSMQLDAAGGNQHAVIHATCAANAVSIHTVKFVTGSESDAKEAADALVNTLGIDLGDVYVVPAGSLTKPAKRGGRRAKE